MEITSSMLFGQVMHKRLFPKDNTFVYGIYYLVLPLSGLHELSLPVNRFGLISFNDRDHGYRDGSSLEGWAHDILQQFSCQQADGEIVLVTMPRVLGYVFNPVSFWLCYDKQSRLRAVLCEVNNTFNETHTYFCAHTDFRPIQTSDTLKGKKVFHVSPFLPRDGEYSFRFNCLEGKASFHIDYFANDGRKQLITSLAGKLEKITPAMVRRAFWRYPLVSLKAIGLIHWQAIKLFFKKATFYRKPAQVKPRLSGTEGLENQQATTQQKE